MNPAPSDPSALRMSFMHCVSELVRHFDVGPDRRDELVFSKDAAGIPNEIGEEGKRFTTQGDIQTALPQPPLSQVEHVAGKFY